MSDTADLFADEAIQRLIDGNERGNIFSRRWRAACKYAGSQIARTPVQRDWAEISMMMKTLISPGDFLRQTSTMNPSSGATFNEYRE